MFQHPICTIVLLQFHAQRVKNGGVSDVEGVPEPGCAMTVCSITAKSDRRYLAIPAIAETGRAAAP